MKTLLLSFLTLGLLPLPLFALPDYGDAPVNYGAPYHSYTASPGYILGAAVDGEPAARSSPDALGDDQDGTDDEDGVTATAVPGKAIIPWQRGAWTQLQVQVQLPPGITEAKLDAWVDWDGMGGFIPAEAVLDSYRVHPGLNLIAFKVPLTAASGITFARYRLTSAGLGPAGYVGSVLEGEVEDCRLTIKDPSPATTVQAYQRDGQVWVTWDFTPAAAAQVYDVYRSTNAAWNNVSQGTLVASLFYSDYAAGQLTEELTAAFGGAAQANFTIPAAVVGNPPVTLPASRGLCVSTVRVNGDFSYAVVPRGVTGIVVANKTPLIPQVFNAVDAPRPQPQQSGLVSGYPVTFYSTWADGGDAGDTARPDYPFTANRNGNANTSLFIVMEPPGGVPAGAVPAAIALHSGDARAAMWLPGQPGFINAGMAPVNGYIICMEDKLTHLTNGIPDPTNTRWLGYVPTFDAKANLTTYAGSFPVTPPPALGGEVVQPYTLNRLNWTLSWLLGSRNIDAQRVAILGHSGGAKGSLLWSHANPERFSSVCLFNPALGDTSRNPVLQSMQGGPSENLVTTLTNRFGGNVLVNDTAFLTRSISPLRDSPPTRYFLGQNESNWVVDSSGDLLSDALEDAKLGDTLATGAVFYWDQREHGVDRWAGNVVAADLPACGLTPPDFWIPTAAQQTRRDDADYQLRYRSNQSYPAFFHLRSYANHGAPGSIDYGGIPFIETEPWTGPADPCLPQWPLHHGDHRGTWGGYFDWITNPAAANAIVDTPEQWESTLFLSGPTGPEGEPHGPAEACPFSTLKTDVAIRRPQNFHPDNGSTVSFVTVAENTGAVVQSGFAGFDSIDVVTVPGINVPRDPARLRLIVASQLDFGDAPSCYPVRGSQNGARHMGLAGFFLGSALTLEREAAANGAATGDGASDDGITLPPVFPTGSNVTVGLRASAAGKVDAWIDWNADGDWADAGEQILASRSVAAGVQNVSIATPPGAVAGQTYARFRLSRAGGLAPTGVVPDGEVEDYQINIVTPPGLIAPPVVSADPLDTLRYATDPAGHPVFQWLGRPDEMATLETSTDLVTWTVWYVSGAPASTRLVEFPVPVLAGPRQFFRLLRTPLETSVIPCAPGSHLKLGYTFGGRRRTYSLFVPPQHPDSDCPLALILHGGNQSGTEFISLRGGELFAAAAARSMILCLPDALPHDGLDTAWYRHDEIPGLPYVDDQAFLDALILHLGSELQVDGDRLYAAGFSNGGQMTHYLGARTTTRFAALATCASDIGVNVFGFPSHLPTPVPSLPRPVLIINLLDDPTMPFLGSADKQPAIDQVTHWATANGAPPAPIPPVPSDSAGTGITPHSITTNNYLYPGNPVRFVVIESGGHTWPDAADGLGYDANTAVLDWLLSYNSH